MGEEYLVGDYDSWVQIKDVKTRLPDQTSREGISAPASEPSIAVRARDTWLAQNAQRTAWRDWEP